ARHLLDDLRGADERALLAVEELRELPRLLVAARRGSLLAGHPIPDVRAEDAARLLRQPPQVFAIAVVRPVDARRLVPPAGHALAGRRGAASRAPPRPPSERRSRSFREPPMPLPPWGAHTVPSCSWLPSSQDSRRSGHLELSMRAGGRPAAPGIRTPCSPDRS